MCNQKCENCYYTAINNSVDGHCYMFRKEPEGDCSQFKFSEAAKVSMKEALEALEPLTSITSNS